MNQLVRPEVECRVLFFSLLFLSRLLQNKKWNWQVKKSFGHAHIDILTYVALVEYKLQCLYLVEAPILQRWLCILFCGHIFQYRKEEI